jgi:tellurite resistance protein TerC
MVRRAIAATYRRARRITVGVIGGSVVAIGVAMIVLPGPAVVVIPVGLGILSLEFAWARRWLHAARGHAPSAASRARRGSASR